MATKEPKSIMHKSMGGMVVVSGLQGLGKSTFAFTAENPKLTCVLDMDLKGEDMAKDYSIANFHQPDFMTPDMDPLDYDAGRLATWFIDKIKGVKPGITNLVIDNATAAEAGLGHIVAQNPAAYGLNPSNVAAGRYGGVNPGITILWNQITTFLKNKGVRTIFMVNHMTSPWANGQPVPNRFHIKGNKIFRNLSALTVILVPGSEKRGGRPPIPAGLVVKEAMGKREWNDDKGEFVTQRVFPTRFPVMDWKDIKGYFKTPADFKKPAPGEFWTNAELNAYGEFMSEEQIEWIKSAAQAGYSEDGPTPTGNQPKKETAEQGKQRLLKELQPLYKDMNDLSSVAKELKLSYKHSEHDQIREKLRAHRAKK